MAETAIAFRCNDYVMVAAAGLNAFYYIKITDEEDKITPLDTHQLVACIGENGPRVHFTEYIKRNLALNRMRQHGRHSSCESTANFMRNSLANAIRSREGAYQVNCLFAGYDVPVSEDDDGAVGPQLFYMDYLGTLQAVPFGCHGYGASFVTALLDRLWRPDLSQREGLELMQKCCDEVKRRVVISNAHFFVKAVTKGGVEVISTVH
ncbi:hypothetical protein LSCM1_00032 [Leishmania martiniquensis]|uniref:Proteasome subunit beta n=1 Tax=Leishmania martiniquensis TaxID=1580590 RepID=A0A836GEQ8_9TRYP|nr:hypothetical protein LSCM1_00032 [Leishmania martiniquensis]